MALGNASNPIIKNSEPDLKTTKWGTISVGSGSQQTSLERVYSGGDATRGGATAVLAAGDGQAAAREIVGDIPFSRAEIEDHVERASRYTDLSQAPQTILKKVDLAEGIVEMTVKSPLIAKAAQAGQFLRVLPTPKGELIPLTLADWDAHAGRSISSFRRSAQAPSASTRWRSARPSLESPGRSASRASCIDTKATRRSSSSLAD
jgi:glutamate synthase (NADPH/NADH) small chain